MAFLIETDYRAQIKGDQLDKLTDYNNLTRFNAEIAAQGEMESYLRTRFDVVNIFNKADSERNPLIVMYLIDLALYHLFSAITPRNVPQIRMDRYDMAIKWLQEVNNGTIDPGLPAKVDTEGNIVGTSIIESRTKNGYDY